MKLANRNALVTGGSIGFGEAIAREFVKEGANIIICARNKDQIEKTKELLVSLSKKPDQIIDTIRCDISNPRQLKELFKFSLEKLGTIEVLVNNAGICGPKGPAEILNLNEWIKTIQINLIGTFVACQEALRLFKKQKYGKIINLSSEGATAPLPFLSAYAASKAAIVRTTETLAEEVKDFNIDINALDPGGLNTRLLDEILEAGPEKVGQEYYDKAIKQKDNGGAPLKIGAELCVYLASAHSDGITGKLINAIWDGWSDFNSHTDDIKNTDIYTLRRIIPKERGMDWE